MSSMKLIEDVHNGKETVTFVPLALYLGRKHKKK